MAAAAKKGEHKSEEKAAAPETNTESRSVKLGVGTLLLFSTIFAIVYIIIAFVTRPAVTSLGLTSDSAVSIANNWGTAIPFLGLVWAVISFVIMLIIAGIIRLIGFGNTKTRTLAILISLLPWLAWGIQLVYYEKWWTDVARLVIPLVGYPMFMASWIVMVIALIYGIIGIVRKK